MFNLTSPLLIRQPILPMYSVLVSTVGFNRRSQLWVSTVGLNRGSQLWVSIVFCGWLVNVTQSLLLIVLVLKIIFSIRNLFV